MLCRGAAAFFGGAEEITVLGIGWPDVGWSGSQSGKRTNGREYDER